MNNTSKGENIKTTNIENIGGIQKWQVNTIIILGIMLFITLSLIFFVIAFKKPTNSINTTKKINTCKSPEKICKLAKKLDATIRKSTNSNNTVEYLLKLKNGTTISATP